MPIITAALGAFATRSIYAAYASVVKQGSLLPPPGNLIAYAAGAAAVAGVMAQAKSASRQVDDFTSGPGGITTMMGPAGVFELNPRDSVLATTNPIPVNDLRSFPAGTQEVGIGGGEYVLRAEGNDLVARVALGPNFGFGRPGDGMM